MTERKKQKKNPNQKNEMLARKCPGRNMSILESFHPKLCAKQVELNEAVKCCQTI